jgi:hypothetical protein
MRRRTSDVITDEDWTSLLAFLMLMDRKLDRILEDLEIDDGHETD